MSLEVDSAEQARSLELAFAGVVASVIVALTIAVTEFTSVDEQLNVETVPIEPIVVFPDFASISDIDVKKQQFFDFFQDFVRYENGLISNQRLQLLSYAELVDDGVPLSERERDWVWELARSYEVATENASEPSVVDELLMRVDVIPASMVLAQAANESAWGTSRFALEGNNIFGQWCYEEGCGIVPSRRIEGATHEVKSFNTIEESIESYFLNINTHHLYADFREERARLRENGSRLDPIALVEGLERYSQRGENYIDEVQTLIQQNDLRKRDRRWLEK